MIRFSHFLPPIISCLILFLIPFTGCLEQDWRPSYQTTYQVQVEHIIDGDTIIITLPNGTTDTLRFLGIDCPEIQTDHNHPREYGTITDLDCLSSFARIARDKIDHLLNTSTIVIEFDNDAGLKDTYDRWLGYVYLLNGTDLNALLVKQGYARVFTLESFYKKEAYLSFEEHAMENHLGIWSCS